MSRETDIKELCNSVLNINLDRFCNPNGADTGTCPLCSVEEQWADDIDDITHKTNCGYLIAKDLMTNI